MSCSRKSIFSNSGALYKAHGDVVRNAGRVAAAMALARRDMDADVEYSGRVLLHTHSNSRRITGGLRAGMVPARDRVDGHATQTREIIRDDSGVPVLPNQAQLPGHRAKQIISGSGTGHRLVGIEYELPAADAAQDRAEAGRNDLRQCEGRERDLERRQQCAAKQNLSQSREAPMRRPAHVHGTIE